MSLAPQASSFRVAPDDARARRLIVTLALGFASGLPLALSRGTLTFFLARFGVSIEAVGLFGLVGIPYSYKFLWAPLIDRLRPFPFAFLGRRRGWLLLAQLGLFASIVATAFTNPDTAPLRTACGALGIAFFSATQDVVIDALRVETLSERDQGWGAALTTWGYRIGMLASGFGALHLADLTTFRNVYAAMAGLAIVASLATWFVIEPHPEARQKAGSLVASLQSALIEPFQSLAQRHPFRLIALFLMVYKLGDVWSGHLASVYFVQAGFTGAEIANVTKFIGVIATMVGVGLGGALISRVSPRRCLPYGAVIMSVSNLGYAWLATRGHDVNALVVAVGIENVTSGIGSSIAIAWLSSLCAPGKTATQYALLSALTSMSATHLVALSGYVKTFTDGFVHHHQTMQWPVYFTVTAAAGLPGIGLAFMILVRESQEEPSETEAPALP